MLAQYVRFSKSMRMKILVVLSHFGLNLACFWIENRPLSHHTDYASNNDDIHTTVHENFIITAILLVLLKLKFMMH